MGNIFPFGGQSECSWLQRRTQAFADFLSDHAAMEYDVHQAEVQLLVCW